MTPSIRLLAVAACLPVLLITGCGRKEGRRPVEIVYWTGWSGHELELQQKLVDEFERTHPHIRVRLLSVFGSYQKVRIAFAGGDTPDVCSAVWATELAGYAMRGALTPLDDFLAKSGRRKDEWVPGAWEMQRYNNRTWGLLGTINANFIVYNRAEFARRNLHPPRDLDEWIRVNKACIERNVGGGYKVYGMRPSNLVEWAYVFGGHWYEPETGKVTATHPANIRALKFLQDFARENDIRRMENFESTFGSQQTPQGPFFTGKQLMMATGPWIEEFIRRFAPKGFDYGYFPYPAPAGGRRNCTTLNSSVFVIPAASKHKEEAWEFINWFLSPAQNVRFCSAMGNNSPLKAVAAMPEMRKEPILRFSADICGGTNAFGPPQMPVWPTYLAQIARAEDFAVHQGKDPKALLEEVQRRVEKELRRARKEAVY